MRTYQQRKVFEGRQLPVVRLTVKDKANITLIIIIFFECRDGEILAP